MSATAVAPQRLEADAEELPEVRATARFLQRHRQQAGHARLVSPDGDELPLPDSMYNVLLQAARLLAESHAIMLIPVETELTTFQAAALLNVSRPFLIQLLDEGAIPHRKVGTHRRIRYADLMEYKQARDVKRRQTLRDLTRMSQELGLLGKEG